MNKSKTDAVKGVIIDLRNNPGGYLDTALNIIDLFSKKPVTAIILKDKNGIQIKYQTTGDGRFAEIPIKVLINEGSASASEILAGALKDNKLATIYGTLSFGKGSVQELTQFEDGSMLKYTISNWLTPNGDIIQKRGIKPNVEIKDDEKTEKDEQLDKVLQSF